MEVTCPNCDSRKNVEAAVFDALYCTVCPTCGALFGTRPQAQGGESAETLSADDIIVIPEESPGAFAADQFVASAEDVLEADAPAAAESQFTVPPSASAVVVTAPAQPSSSFAEAAPAQEAEPAAEAEIWAPLPPAARPAPDGYAVGMRVLRVAPAWLLLSSLGFLAVLLLFNWMSKPVGEAVAATAPESVLQNAATSTTSEPVAPKPAKQGPAPSKPAVEQPAPQKAAQPATEPAAPSETGGKFTVQVGAFSNVSEANERVSALRAAGFDARAEAAEIPNRGVWHRVRVGRLATREDASRLASELRSKGAAAQAMVAEIQK